MSTLQTLLAIGPTAYSTNQNKYPMQYGHPIVNDSLMVVVRLSRLRKRIENHLRSDNVILPALTNQTESERAAYLTISSVASEAMSDVGCERNERNCVGVSNLGYVVVSRSPSGIVLQKRTLSARRTFLKSYDPPVCCRMLM